MLHFETLWNAHPSIRNEHIPGCHENIIFASSSAVAMGITLKKCGVDTSLFPGVEHCLLHGRGLGHSLRAEELALALKKYKLLGLQPVRVISPKDFQHQMQGQTGIVFFKGYRQARMADQDTLMRIRPKDHIDLWNGHKLAGHPSVSMLLPQTGTGCERPIVDALPGFDPAGAIWFWPVDNSALTYARPRHKKKPTPDKKPTQTVTPAANQETSEPSQTIDEMHAENNKHANDSPECMEKGHPVNAVTGAVVETVMDFTVPGRIPLIWARHYSSQETAVGLLGTGWQCPADERLRVDNDGHVIVSHANKTASIFPYLPDSEQPTVFDAKNDKRLSQNSTHYIVTGKDNLSKHFPKASETKTRYLEKISDAQGNALQFWRDRDNLTGITDSSGMDIRVVSKNGRIQSMVRATASGHETPLIAYAYDPQTRDLISVTDNTGVPLTYAYDNHCLTSLTFRSGLTFHYAYDKATPTGKCLHTWGDDGLYDYRFEYHDAIRQTRVTNSLGAIETISYNADYKPISVVDHIQHHTRYTYNAQGKPTSITDALGRKTTYDYDTLGNLTAVTRPDGSVIRMTCDAQGNPIAITDPNGNAWHQTFNDQALLTQRTSPAGVQTHYEYSPQGDLICVTAPNGGTTRITYDDAGQITAITRADGSMERFERDVFGNIIFAGDPTGRKTGYVYDDAFRLIKIIKPSGGTITCDYDAENRLIRHTDEAGNTTQLTYTGLSKIKTRTNPDGTEVHYHYDTEERLKTLTNERGEIYEFKRDHAGRITNEIDYWGNERHYSYDPTGQLLKSIDPLNRITTFKTDPLGRLIEKTFGDGTRETFVFDPNGNLTAHENNQARVERIFDAENRLTQEIQGDQSTLHEYDALGNRTRRVSALGNDIRFDYDILGRTTGITINGAAMAITRNALGLPTKETFANGLERTYDYTADNQLSDQVVVLPRGNTITRAYEYDPVGNLTARIDADKGSRYFTYNPMGRITQYTDPEQKIKDFLHDPAGDLFKRSQNEESDGSWHLDHDQTDYHYNAAGNLIERSGKRGHHTFDWDANNRLISAMNTDTGTQTCMTYDAQGRRLSKTTDDQTTTFTWDGDQLLSDNVGGNNAREFVYYPGSFEPLAIIDVNKTINLIHTDSVGLPHEVTDDNGNIVWSASYDALGSLDQLHVDSFDNPLRFQGQYYDSEIDLSYNRYRYFDVQTGSFISQDPLGLTAGNNVYDYAPNVWGWIDPLGLCKKEASNNRPDFYVGPSGPESTLPSTAYRYDRYLNDDGTPNKWGKTMIAKNEGIVTYFGFEKYNTGTQAADAFQVKTMKHVNPLDPADSSWSDARLRGEFDTLQLYDNGLPKARVPRAFGDKVGADPEPFTTAYPAYGEGGAQQLHADKKNIKFDKVDILPEK